MKNTKNLPAKDRLHVAIGYKLRNCRFLTDAALWNLIDNFPPVDNTGEFSREEAPQWAYWGALEEYGADFCRGAIMGYALRSMGVIETLRVILEYYHYKSA